jgi:hypothetical protein
MDPKELEVQLNLLLDRMRASLIEVETMTNRMKNLEAAATIASQKAQQESLEATQFSTRVNQNNK